MPVLLNLPNELRVDISHHLKTEDVHSVGLINRYLHTLFENRLYPKPPTHLLKCAIDTNNLKPFGRIIENVTDVKVQLTLFAIMRLSRVRTRFRTMTRGGRFDPQNIFLMTARIVFRPLLEYVVPILRTHYPSSSE
jgi:hypothetical protein